METATLVTLFFLSLSVASFVQGFWAAFWNVLTVNSSSSYKLAFLLGWKQYLRSVVNAMVFIDVATMVLVGSAWAIVHKVFGRLTETEQRKVREHAFMFILFKMVFITAVLDYSIMEYLVWVLWFGVVAILQGFAVLSLLRFKEITARPNVGREDYVHYLLFTLTVLFADIGMITTAFHVFYPEAGFTAVFLLTMDCVDIFLRCAQGCALYTIHIATWEREELSNLRERYIYTIDSAMEVGSNGVQALNYLYIWYVHGLSLTAIDILLFIYARTCILRMSKTIRNYRNFQAVLERINNSFPSASKEQLEKAGVCAICRDPMEEGKRLPCSDKHCFHLRCLEGWMRYKTECPICRFNLMDNLAQGAQRQPAGRNANAANPIPAGAAAAPPAAAVPDAPGAPGPAAAAGPPPNNNGDAPPGQGQPGQGGVLGRLVNRQSMFALNTGNWPILNWLPIFSLEMIREQGVDFQFNGQPVDAQIQRIVEIFPNIERNVIQAALAQAGSATAAINDLMNGRMPPAHAVAAVGVAQPPAAPRPPAAPPPADPQAPFHPEEEKAAESSPDLRDAPPDPPG